MNYREKIRKAIECPQFNNTGYGEWGSLNLEQRKYIKRLLDELDHADNYIKKLYFKNQKQKEVIDKANKKLNNFIECCKAEKLESGSDYIHHQYWDMFERFNKQIKDILKEVSE